MNRASKDFSRDIQRKLLSTGQGHTQIGIAMAAQAVLFRLLSRLISQYGSYGEQAEEEDRKSAK
jgi:hypothetical protein